MQWDEAVLFAGGHSSRMGRDKALLPFGGYATLAEYQYRRLRKWFRRVSLSAKTDKFSFDAPLVVDRYPDHSPIVALASVLENLQSDWVFVLSVDMPHVDRPLITRLYDALTTHPGVRAVVSASPRGREPLCALYHRELLPVAQAQLHRGEHRMRTLIASVPSAEILCTRDTVFANLNTPDDYARHNP